VDGTSHPINTRTISGGYDIALNDTQYHVLTDWSIGDSLIRANVDGRDVTFPG
ncbi:unnamed protein product, partial [marine sediment metagenome]